jgi:hypothetical protein
MGSRDARLEEHPARVGDRYWRQPQGCRRLIAGLSHLCATRGDQPLKPILTTCDASLSCGFQYPSSFPEDGDGRRESPASSLSYNPTETCLARSRSRWESPAAIEEKQSARSGKTRPGAFVVRPPNELFEMKMKHGTLRSSDAARNYAAEVEEPLAPLELPPMARSTSA